MSEPLQSLAVVRRLFPLVLSGQKTSTIRWRERRIISGPMRYVCEGDPARSAVVNVLRCTDMPLSQAAAFLGKADDEWSDAALLAAMREHYPDIRLSDTVQVIEHSRAVRSE